MDIEVKFCCMNSCCVQALRFLVGNNGLKLGDVMGNLHMFSVCVDMVLNIDRSKSNVVASGFLGIGCSENVANDDYYCKNFFCRRFLGGNFKVVLMSIIENVVYFCPELLP